MTDTIEPVATQIDQMQLAQQLVEQARAEVMALICPDGVQDRTDLRAQNLAQLQ